MTAPTNVEVHEETKGLFTSLAAGDPDLLAAGLEIRANWQARSGLSARDYALVKLAAQSGQLRVAIRLAIQRLQSNERLAEMFDAGFDLANNFFALLKNRFARGVGLQFFRRLPKPVALPQ